MEEGWFLTRLDAFSSIARKFSEVFIIVLVEQPVNLLDSVPVWFGFHT